MVRRSIVLLVVLLISFIRSELVHQELEVEHNDSFKENVLEAIKPELREKLEHLLVDISQQEDEEEYLKQHLTPEEQDELSRILVDKLMPFMPDHIKQMYNAQGGQFTLENSNHTNTPNETGKEDEGEEDEEFNYKEEL